MSLSKKPEPGSETRRWYDAVVTDLRRFMATLSPDERLALIEDAAYGYCIDARGCGREDPENRCQCENDE